MGRLEMDQLERPEISPAATPPVIDDQPGGLGALPLPQLDAGPFLSYGIQWIAFGIVAPLGLGYFIYSEMRTRRQEAARKADQQASAAPLSREDRLADRYGRRR